jgi:hypothetical protein
MLAACRLAGLSALEAYYDAVKAGTQPKAVGVQKLPVFSLNREPPRLTALASPLGPPYLAPYYSAAVLRAGWPPAGFSASGGFWRAAERSRQCAGAAGKGSADRSLADQTSRYAWRTCRRTRPCRDLPNWPPPSHQVRAGPETQVWLFKATALAALAKASDGQEQRFVSRL